MIDFADCQEWYHVACVHVEKKSRLLSESWTGFTLIAKTVYKLPIATFAINFVY